MNKDVKKYQGALDRLWKETKGNLNTSSMSNRSDRDLLKELVDKATPMKPLNVKQVLIASVYPNIRYNSGECPVCGSKVDEWQCCSNNDCRQMIDWSEDNER